MAVSDSRGVGVAALRESAANAAASPLSGRLRRSRARVAWVLLAIVAIFAAVEGWRWKQAVRWNDVIAGRAQAPDVATLPPEVRFSQASALAAAGRHEEALNRYRGLQGDSPVGQAARYNSANILLRQALEIRETNQPGLAIPMIELAKETYREVLRHDPSQWDARYNLERAQRLLPDPEESEEPPAMPPQNAERAATTMRGYSAGLP